MLIFVVCCLREVRWKDQRARRSGNDFEFLWIGSSLAENGVGVIVAIWLVEKVVSVERYSDESECYDQRFCLGGVSCYCPQPGNLQQRATFNGFINKVITSAKVLVEGNFNGYAGCDMGILGEVHRGFGIGQINDRVVRLMACPSGKGLCLIKTCFEKRKGLLITF